MKLLEQLQSPDREYTPIPFWFLNAPLDAAEIERQLTEFADHGVYGVVLHPRIGMDPAVGYLSEAFFDAIGTAIACARRLDMQIVLYDEGMYPSGSASGLVVQGHPELKSRGLGYVETPEEKDIVLARAGQKYLVERMSEGTIRGIHFGEDDGEPFAPKSADILNPVAVDRFLELTHEAYYRHFSEDFGETIIGFFTDEPSILGRNTRDLMPWTAGFAELFQKSGGNLMGLAGLFEGTENADTALYHRLILQRESEVYYARLSRWCEAHGIALMGHPHQSDDIEVERYFHVPGQDLVFRWVSPEKGDTEGMDSVMGKCSADAAYLMHRRRNANECFGACNRGNHPWYFTGGDMKWFLDYLAVRGVNLFIPHAFYYSLEGPRSGERPPDVGPGSLWWPHYRIWADYMTRLSFLMTDVKRDARIAVLCKNRDLRPEMVKLLFETQRSFQYLPESFWNACRKEGNVLVCGDMRFSACLGGKTEALSFGDPMAVSPDVVCIPPVPQLRVAHFVRLGVECYFCVNSGETELDCEVRLPVSGRLGAADLFRMRTWRVHAAEDGQGLRFMMRLKRRESRLYFVCDRAEWDALDAEKVPDELTGVCFQEVFSGEGEKRYRADAVLEGTQGQDRVLPLQAEEMVELYVNECFADVSFFMPHELRIPGALLRSGINTLEIRVKGSLANRYGKVPVPYGLSV
ncbi:MAG: hypothetical protein IJ246_00295 [Clostridia bacterium]|nr:hypothetical protein [Clostridia bacterium]